jgi:hypothetical protein
MITADADRAEAHARRIRTVAYRVQEERRS